MSRHKQAWILLVISLVIWLLDFLGVISFINKGFIQTTNNLQAGIFLRRKPVLSPSLTQGEQEKLIIDLQNQVNILTEELISAKKLLGADLPPNMKFYPASLIGYNRNMIRVNAGVKQGVEVGNEVVFENILVGRIVEARENTSLVELLSNSSFESLVGIWSKDAKDNLPIKAILKGGEPLIVEEVLIQEKISPGDVVACFDCSHRFAIGEIARVWEADNGLFKKATVDWLVDPKKLVTVFVVK